ncbi:phage major tail tube protein [Haematospirillum jordaniae]|uniref:Phage tail protein n=1 Tax=Haematospirillum jordaniae TaxID=1549855 RepID=A0A143DHQ6_9PROT|nr:MULTISPECIES: phage major tail tube protein [Haematospirillum]AMW35738.1 hypothetical protein AY555_10185 [Haematospirillum jordaniae]NKD46021.1 phage major tail tube protein [Haematospirillum jordaniae]NKD60146.1 phage major tail tube protein [Haematospirillum jordaniae]NKD68071.1 phage major tail tube protein [Haematospirillum jordaniae]NKD82244.1 phage major tail tube protein [Haematospirillum jordaniae]
MLPMILKNFNVFIDGRGMAGIAEEVVLPKLERSTEEWRAAGMAGPVLVDLGMEPLKMEFTLGEFNSDVLRAWGLSDVGGLGVRFVAAGLAADGVGTSAVDITVRGRWKSIDMGTIKAKDMAKMKVEMPLTYYCYSSNGSKLVEIDMLGGTELVGGIDRASAISRAIGLPGMPDLPKIGI